MLTRLIPVLVFVVVILSSCGDDVTGTSGGSGSHISVVLVNNSGESLYVIINRADNFWLKNIGDSSSWTTSFDASDCMVSVEAGNSLSFAFPEYSSGFGCRMYLGDTAFAGAPNLATYQHIYDKVEMGWNATWNLTCVDFIAIPMQLESGGVTVGFKGTVTRQSLMQALEAMPGPYSNFCLRGSGGDIVRFFSPKQFMNNPDSLQDCLGAAISVGLPLLASAEIPGGEFTYGAFSYSDINLVGDNGLTALCDVGGSSVTVTLDSISTMTVVGNTIPYTPSDSSGATFAGLIGAAVNRGVLYNPAKWGDSTPPNQGLPQYYYQAVPDSNATEFNHYAAVLHENSLDGLCYGHSFDDYFMQDASLTVNSGDNVTITVLPFE